jgi:hypothetical protein
VHVTNADGMTERFMYNPVAAGSTNENEKLSFHSFPVTVQVQGEAAQRPGDVLWHDDDAISVVCAYRSWAVSTAICLAVTNMTFSLVCRTLQACTATSRRTSSSSNRPAAYPFRSSARGPATAVERHAVRIALMRSG